MNYPRRRAPIACNFCRQRKRKCDGNKPACSLCDAAGIICDYNDDARVNVGSAVRPMTNGRSSRGGSGDGVAASEGPQSPLAVSNYDVMRRLEKLESRIRQQVENNQPVNPDIPQETPDMPLPTLQDGISGDGGLPAFFSSILEPPELSLPALQYNPQPTPGLDNGDYALVSRNDHSEEDEEPMTIPIGHLTPTGSLFSLEPIHKLIGDYPEDYFFQVESARPFEPQLPGAGISEALSALNTTPRHTETLLEAFFANVHPHFPIIEPDNFNSFFRDAMHTDSDPSDQGLCLIILALGELARKDRGSSAEEVEDGTSKYFSLAYSILTTRWVISFGFDLSLASGLVYSAIYLCYLQRPLHAWKLVHMASTKLQMMVSGMQSEPVGQAETDCVGHLCWTCFLLECDSLAEFHLPRSGIELLIERMQFPCFTDRINNDGLSFLAICSIRRLLNRIHHAIYGTPRKSSMASETNTAWAPSPPNTFCTVNTLGGVCEELARQLDVWYQSLPDCIRPDLTDNVPKSLHESWLRLRYWSAYHIITRPCLVYAASLADHTALPGYALEYSEICVNSVRNYITSAKYVLRERTQYNWQTIQASLACAFVVVIASGSPLLRHLVPDADSLLKEVITATQRWASPGSSAESIGWILKTISQKQRLSKMSSSRYRLSAANSATVDSRSTGSWRS